MLANGVADSASFTSAVSESDMLRCPIASIMADRKSRAKSNGVGPPERFPSMLSTGSFWSISGIT